MRFPTIREDGKVLVVIAFLWAFVATVHVTQGIWTSGWDDYLGDEVDGRLNNLLLEHGYQSLLGDYDFESPAQFYPTRGTIAYSEMHIGTLPLYVIGRIAGLSVEGAYQGWTVSIALLNCLAFMVLLRALKVPWVLVGPMVFLGASPASLVAFAGTHIQVFPVFAFSLATAKWIRFFEDWKLKHVLQAFGFLALLHLCSPYLGFFGSLAALIVLIASVILFRREIVLNAKDIWESRYESRSSWLFVLAMGFGVLGMYWLYQSQLELHGGREWKSIVSLSPHWKLWTMAPGGHWIYGDFFTRGKTFNASEHSLFSGLMPWVALPVAICFALIRKSDSSLRWQLVFGVAAIGVIAFFTRWDDSGSGVYLWLARRFEGLSAFRASSRSIIIIHVLQALALCSVLTLVYRERRSRLGRWIVLAIGLFAAVESARFEQGSTSKERVRLRRIGVAEAWLEAGGNPNLIFAPGSYSGSPQAAHLDAWSAAMGSGKYTLNGYSGSVPASHSMFLLTPTLENAENLLRRLNLAESDYSIVESWGGREEDLGLEVFEGYPVARLEGFELQPTSWRYAFPVGMYAIDGVELYQFAPDMTARFQIPSGARKVRMLIGLREGAYTVDGKSDGVGVHWSIKVNGNWVSLNDLYLNPMDNLEQRGMNAFSFEIPPNASGDLKLDVDGGPRKNTAWDWLMIGRLRAE